MPANFTPPPPRRASDGPVPPEFLRPGVRSPFSQTMYPHPPPRIYSDPPPNYVPSYGELWPGYRDNTEYNRQNGYVGFHLRDPERPKIAPKSPRAQYMTQEQRVSQRGNIRVPHNMTPSLLDARIGSNNLTRLSRTKREIDAVEGLTQLSNTNRLKRVKRPANGGQINIYTGPKNGKYIIKNGSKVYIDSKSLTNNVQYKKKKLPKKR